MSENGNNDNEYKTLNEAHIGTIKELNRIVREQAKRLEQMNNNECKTLDEAYISTVKELGSIVREQTKSLVSKCDTRWKHITIFVIAIALFAAIVLCCKYSSQSLEIKCVSQCDNQYMNIKYLSDTIKVQIEKKCKEEQDKTYP